MPGFEHREELSKEAPVCPSADWAKDFVANWTADRMRQGLGPVQTMPEFIDMAEAADKACRVQRGESKPEK